MVELSDVNSVEKTVAYMVADSVYSKDNDLVASSVVCLVLELAAPTASRMVARRVLETF